MDKMYVMIAVFALGVLLVGCAPEAPADPGGLPPPDDGPAPADPGDMPPPEDDFPDDMGDMPEGGEPLP